ncbi:MAG TPA: hypothetical protein VMU39_12995, partial [Solirubrobacteraceae bacterium]|nr:hypothetical protein [Solirubrobacteraceae bacterium]
RWLVAAAVFAVPVGTADAAVVVAEGARSQPARVVNGWLRRLALPLPRGTITVSFAPCPGILWVDGCSAPGAIWLRPSFADRAVLLHELGHQFDYGQPPWARAAFEALGHDPRPWDAAPNGPDEQFAEAWMGCAAPAIAADRFDSATGRDEFAYGYRPTPRELRRACTLIRRAGRAGARPVAPSAPPLPST